MPPATFLASGFCDDAFGACKYGAWVAAIAETGAIISREIDGFVIPQRKSDGYVSATSMCKAVGKKMNDYTRIAVTEAFLAALSTTIGIPILELVVVDLAARNGERATWVHPKVAIHLAH